MAFFHVGLSYLYKYKLINKICAIKWKQVNSLQPKRYINMSSVSTLMKMAVDSHNMTKEGYYWLHLKLTKRMDISYKASMPLLCFWCLPINKSNSPNFYNLWLSLSMWANLQAWVQIWFKKKIKFKSSQIDLIRLGSSCFF